MQSICVSPICQPCHSPSRFESLHSTCSHAHGENRACCHFFRTIPSTVYIPINVTPNRGVIGSSMLEVISNSHSVHCTLPQANDRRVYLRKTVFGKTWKIAKVVLCVGGTQHFPLRSQLPGSIASYIRGLLHKMVAVITPQCEAGAYTNACPGRCGSSEP